MKNLIRAAGLLLGLTACTGSGEKKTVADSLPEHPSYFTYDYTERPPQVELKLSDLADVEYVPLQIGDGFLVSDLIDARGLLFCVTREYIFAKDNPSRSLLIFDRQGRPVRRIDRYGKGPQEYLSIMAYAVDTVGREIFVLDSKRRAIQVYDWEGNHKRRLAEDCPAFEMTLANDTTLLCYDKLSYSYPYFTLLSTRDGHKIKDLEIDLDRPIEDPHGMIGHGALVPVHDGLEVSTLRSDVTYHLDTALNLSRRFRDVSGYDDRRVQLYPFLETERYLLCQLMSYPYITPDIPSQAYLYDKRKKRLYAYDSGEDKTYPWAEDYAALASRTLTQDPRILVWSQSAFHLVEGLEKGELPEPLKGIASRLKEDDNPVLIIAHFRDSLPPALN